MPAIRSPVTEAEFNLLLGLMLSRPVAMLAMKDLEHRYLLAKGQVREVYGVIPDSLVGADNSRWLTPDCAREIAAKDRRCMSTGTVSLDVDRLQTADGRRFECHSLRYPCRNESGRIVGLGLVATPLDSSRATDPRALAAEIQAAAEAMCSRAAASSNAARMPALQDDTTECSSSSSDSMPSLQWRKAYESGNEVIDTQHRALLAQSIDIQNGLRSDNDESVMPQVRKLVADIVQHFEDEIRVLQDAGFPDAREHETLHEEEMNAVADAIRKTESGETSIRELVQFIVSFTLVRHMVTADMAFFPYLQQRNDTKSDA